MISTDTALYLSEMALSRLGDADTAGMLTSIRLRLERSYKSALAEPIEEFEDGLASFDVLSPLEAWLRLSLCVLDLLDREATIRNDTVAFGEVQRLRAHILGLLTEKPYPTNKPLP